MSLKRDRFRFLTFLLDPCLLLVILFSLLVIGPLLQPGYFWYAHDARHSVYFLFELDRGIQDGILYPRWQPDFAFGYGYPFFNIYGPLSSYLGEAFHLLGLGFTDAVKAVFALSVVGSGLTMYSFVKQTLGRQAGLVAAVAYMVLPYRLVDLYVRAALAESVAHLFVPLVLWGGWATVCRPRLNNVLGLAVAYAGLLYTHPLTALLLSLILVPFILYLTLGRMNDEQPWRTMSRDSLPSLVGHLGYILIPAVSGFLLGLGLSALFSLPAVTESRFVRVDQWYGGRYAWGGDFVEFFQLFSPQWGFGVSVPGPNDEVSFQLGAVPVVLSLLAIISRYQQRRTSPSCQGRDRTAARLILFFALVTVVAIFLTLEISSPVWQVLPLARLAQFPWRLLALTVVSMAFLCGAILHRTESRRMSLSTFLLVALLLLSSLPYIRVASMAEEEVSLAGLMRFQQSSDEMTGSTAWVRKIPSWSPMADYHIAGVLLTSKINYTDLYRQVGRIHARTLELHGDSELVEYSADRPALLTFNTFYYPGWRAYLLDAETHATIRELPLSLRGELGLITVRIPAGVGRVLLRFEDTPIRKLGTTLTLGSLALVGLLWLGGWIVRASRPQDREP